MESVGRTRRPLVCGSEPVPLGFVTGQNEVIVCLWEQQGSSVAIGAVNVGVYSAQMERRRFVLYFVPTAVIMGCCNNFYRCMFC